MPPVILIPIVIALGGAFLSGVHPAFGFGGAAIALSWCAGLWLAAQVDRWRGSRHSVAPLGRSAEDQAQIDRMIAYEAEHGPSPVTIPF